MCYVYVVEHGSMIGIDGGLLTIKNPGGETTYPKNLVKGISIYSNSTLSNECIKHCLQNKINVGFFSSFGHYRGGLVGVEIDNVSRLKKQISLSSDEQGCLSIAKEIISSKINNQCVVAKRYLRGIEADGNDIVRMINIIKKNVLATDAVDKARGYEGLASRLYFKALNLGIEDGFKFIRRTRRPAQDPFNCMLNIGYSMLSKELYGLLINRGVNPYIGFIHKEKHGHPALVSDLIEEWRPVIVDSAVMSLIRGHEIDVNHFTFEGNSCNITKEGMRILITKIEKKMAVSTNYLEHIERSLSFREALWHQADNMSRAIDRTDLSFYRAVKIR